MLRCVARACLTFDYWSTSNHTHSERIIMEGKVCFSITECTEFRLHQLSRSRVVGSSSAQHIPIRATAAYPTEALKFGSAHVWSAERDQAHCRRTTDVCKPHGSPSVQRSLQRVVVSSEEGGDKRLADFRALRSKQRYEATNQRERRGNATKHKDIVASTKRLPFNVISRALRPCSSMVFNGLSKLQRLGFSLHFPLLSLPLPLPPNTIPKFHT